MSNENSNIETLTNLVELTKTFQAATEHARGSTKRKIKRAVTADEAFDLMGDVMGGMMGGLLSVFGASTPRAPTEESLRQALAKTEKFADLVQRANLSDRKIAKLVLANQRTAENSQALQAAGFPKLASLYAPK